MVRGSAVVMSGNVAFKICSGGVEVTGRAGKREREKQGGARRGGGDKQGNRGAQDKTEKKWTSPPRYCCLLRVTCSFRVIVTPTTAVVVQGRSPFLKSG